MKKSLHNTLYREIERTFRENAPEFWWGDPLDVRFHLVRRLRKLAGKRVLELGCGPGVLLSYLDPGVNTVCGLDTDRNALKLARKIAPGAKSLEQDMYDPLPLSDSEMDIVILAHVHPYTVDNRVHGLVREIARVLKKGGRLLFTSPNQEFAGYRGSGAPDFGAIVRVLSPCFQVKLRCYNPLYSLRYLPGMGRLLGGLPNWNGTHFLLEFLMYLPFPRKWCISFYGEAVKRESAPLIKT